MNERATASEALRREAKWRCLWCAGSGFASLGYPLVGLLYLFANFATITVCGVAVMSFSRPMFVMAGLMFAVVLILHIFEVVVVSKVTIRELHQNRLQKAFVPITVAQLALTMTGSQTERPDIGIERSMTRDVPTCRFFLLSIKKCQKQGSAAEPCFWHVPCHI